MLAECKVISLQYFILPHVETTEQKSFIIMCVCARVCWYVRSWQSSVARQQDR